MNGPLDFVFKASFYFSYEDRSFNRFIIQPRLFNLTATFRTDSDFPIPYMHTKRRHSPCDACLPNSTLLKQKTKFLGWIVSHCSTPSKRERYFAELSKYVQTDKFGGCGKMNKSCPRSEHGNNCTQNIVKRDKFYFSAENAICKDYITG